MSVFPDVNLDIGCRYDIFTEFPHTRFHNIKLSKGIVKLILFVRLEDIQVTALQNSPLYLEKMLLHNFEYIFFGN
jgi:hypothetical protein